MGKGLFIPVLAIGIVAGSAAYAGPASSLRSLVGARGSSGEMELTNKGYVSGKSMTANGGRVVFWGNSSTGACIKVLTKNGRYASITDAPSSACGLRASASGGAKINLASLMGTSGVATFDTMRAKGFAGVDTSTAGNGDLISIYYNRATRQCVQVITANSKVVAATDIQTHAKCR